MPYVKPEVLPLGDVTLRVAATAWSNHLGCAVRRCRRARRCTGRKNRYGLLCCFCNMSANQLDAMVDFFASTSQLATPALFAESLLQATTDEERRMIERRRLTFLYYHAELANEGLAEPLGPPFVEGGVSP